MGDSLTNQTDRATWDPFKRYAYDGITGGYGFALACLLMAFLVRWSLDVYLNDALPYATFILACILIAVYCGVLASLIAVALGGLFSNLFFVTPRYELSLTGLLEQAGMAIYLTISLAAIGLIQTWRWAWKKTELLTRDLSHQMTTKSSTNE
jgi:K+-sensing histidine kinase KdpD